MKKISLLLGITAVLGILLSTGCQDINNDADQQGHLVIKLTDAPFPFDTIDAAIVNITKVEIRKVSEGDEDGNPFISLPIEASEFNLLELRNGITADLVDVEIDPGNYNLIRVYVEDARLSIKQGETYDMKVPSGSQTGIKIFVEPELHVSSELTTDVLLDFSIEKSFILKGNMFTPAGIKGFNFKPVIRAVNITTAGTLEGLVTDTSSVLLEDASVYIIQDEDTINSASTVEGYYALPGIPAGLYTLSSTKEGFDTVTFEGVEVIEGNLTVQDFTLTPVEVNTTTEE
ncbi:MAG: DUF4382 domain-containing protein [Bacteroidota bacterium]|nr:DUF4382 domain-containing protein [Bacteroidota bacterium]